RPSSPRRKSRRAAPQSRRGPRWPESQSSVSPLPHRAGPGWPDLLTRVPQGLAHQVVFFSELRRDELAECEATRQPHNAERYLVAVVRAAATKGVATTMTSQDRPGKLDPGDPG